MRRRRVKSGTYSRANASVFIRNGRYAAVEEAVLASLSSASPGQDAAAEPGGAHPLPALYRRFRTAAPSRSVSTTALAPNAAAARPGAPSPAPISTTSAPLTTFSLRASHRASATPLCHAMLGMLFFAPPRFSRACRRCRLRGARSAAHVEHGAVRAQAEATARWERRARGIAVRAHLQRVPGARGDRRGRRVGDQTHHPVVAAHLAQRRDELLVLRRLRGDGLERCDRRGGRLRVVDASTADAQPGHQVARASHQDIPRRVVGVVRREHAHQAHRRGHPARAARASRRAMWRRTGTSETEDHDRDVFRGSFPRQVTSLVLRVTPQTSRARLGQSTGRVPRTGGSSRRLRPGKRAGALRAPWPAGSATSRRCWAPAAGRGKPPRADRVGASSSGRERRRRPRNARRPTRRTVTAARAPRCLPPATVAPPTRETPPDRRPPRRRLEGKSEESVRDGTPTRPATTRSPSRGGRTKPTTPLLRHPTAPLRRLPRRDARGRETRARATWTR